MKQLMRRERQADSRLASTSVGIMGTLRKSTHPPQVSETVLPKKDGTVQAHEQNLGPEGSSGAETKGSTCLC